MNNVQLREAANQESRRLSTLLLGFSATAIAFAFHETSEWNPTWALLIIAGAVAAWAMSFVSGILWAHAAQDATLMNAATMEISKEHSLYSEVERRLTRAQRRTARRYQTQLATLAIGAALYAAGFAVHVLEQSAAASAGSTADSVSARS